MWESWIDQNGRLRPFITETQIQSVRIPFELALKDSWLQKTVSCPQVDAFASQLVIGLIYCERLQNFCQNGDYDPTTPEASQLADDLIE